MKILRLTKTKEELEDKTKEPEPNPEEKPEKPKSDKPPKNSHPLIRKVRS